MLTIKEQAKVARASRYKRFVADLPRRNGYHERRTDAKGTCIACAYVKRSAHILKYSTTNLWVDRIHQHHRHLLFIRNKERFFVFLRRELEPGT